MKRMQGTEDLGASAGMGHCREGSRRAFEVTEGGFPGGNCQKQMWKDTEIQPSSIFDQEQARIQNRNVRLTNSNTFLENESPLSRPQQGTVPLLVKDLSETQSIRRHCPAMASITLRLKALPMVLKNPGPPSRLPLSLLHSTPPSPVPGPSPRGFLALSPTHPICPA